jgi:hypothetical protein
VSERLDVRVIGPPEVAAQAVARLGGLLVLDREHGPSPSRKPHPDGYRRARPKGGAR